MHSPAPTAASATALDRAAAWAAALTLDAIPARVQRKVRLQIATAVSAAAFAPWHDPARRVLAARRSAGDALVYATGDRVAPADAAFVNSAFAMAHDCDDYMLTGHMSHSAVQVPLAFAAGLDEVVVAAAAADEIMGRLSSASFLGPLNGQMSSYIHNVGAAAAYGVVRRLPAPTLADALGLSLYQPNFCLTPGFWNEGSKTVTASLPLAQGLDAARLAEAGLEGPRDVLDHPLGFPAFFAFARFPGLFDGFGSVWLCDTLCYKRFPGTSYISAGVEGALEAAGWRPVDPASVAAVEVDTTLLSATLDSIGSAHLDRDPLDANAVNFSLKLSVAAALLFGDLSPALLRPAALAAAAPALRALARKVVVRHSWAQTLRLVGASPVGLGMLAHLRPAELARLVAHAGAMRRGNGAGEGNGATLAGLLPALARALPPTLRSARRPVAITDLDPERFAMYQSAEVTLVRAGGQRTRVAVPIPTGACGRGERDAEAVVRWRLETAFGPHAGAVWDAVMTPGTPVAALEAAALAGVQARGGDVAA